MKAAAPDNSQARGGRAILVPQADAIGMIGVIRSLGRAGYRVHACSANAAALGLHSRFAHAAVVHPPYADPGFVPWLDRYIEANVIEAIVPSEGFLVAVQPLYSQYRDLFPDAPDRETMFRCFSKAAVFDSLLSAAPDDPAGHYLPPTVVVSAPTLDALAGRLESFPPPYFVKTDACLGQAVVDGAVYRETTVEGAVSLCRDLVKQFGQVLVQGAVTGRKATVNLLISGDRVLADTMCVALHENPHTGGLTSYRKTWWNQAMREDAERKLRHLGWQGVAMVEYKWDAETGEFYFIELNSRYWAALHLDLFAGSDIPRLQLDTHFGREADPLPRQRIEIRARHTIPADFGYALTRIRDPNVPLPSKLWALLGFFALGLKPGVRTDLLFPGDRGLYWRQWRLFATSVIRSVGARIAGRRRD